MSIFNTPRPKDTNETLNKLVKLTESRRQNYKELLEANDASLKEEELKKELDMQDEKEEAKRKEESSLESLRMRRTDQMKTLKLFNLESDLVKKNADEIFNQVVFEMAYNAFWLDDAIKEKSDLNAMYESFNRIKGAVSSVITESSNQMIDNMKEVCTEACKKAAKRITKKAIDEEFTEKDIDEIDFSFSDAENIDLDDNLAELGKDEIEQMVKDKVLNVIQDEKQAGENKAEALKMIEDEQKALAGGEGEGTEEPAPEEGTDNEVKESYVGAIVARNLQDRVYRSTKSTLFEAIMMHSNQEISEMAATESLKVEMPTLANAVFTDSVFTYTVLETFNTLGLYKFNEINMRKVIDAVSNM